MYNRHKFVMWLILVFVVLIIWTQQVATSQAVLSNLITFFSIVFGFYLTAFSVLFGSKLTQRFSAEEDPVIKTQTKLQTLRNYFRLGTHLSIFSIVAILILQLLGIPSPSGGCIYKPSEVFAHYPLLSCIDTPAQAFVLGIAAMNIVMMLIIVKILLNAFLEESTPEE